MEQPNTQKLEEKWKQQWQQHKQILTTTQKTPEQENAIAQYIYYQQGEAVRKRYYEKLFHNQELPPDKNNLTNQERHIIGKIFLKTHDVTQPDQVNTNHEQYQCPTCTKKFLTVKIVINTDRKDYTAENNGKMTKKSICAHI